MLERIPLLQGYPMTPINPGPNLLRKRTRKQVLLALFAAVVQSVGCGDGRNAVRSAAVPCISGTDVFEDQRSAAREGVDAAFGYGRRCRADQRAEFDPEPAQGGRPRNASDQERPAGVLWDESAHRRGRRLWPCAPVRGTAAHVQALHPR